MIDNVDIAASLPYKLLTRLSVINYAIIKFRSHHGLLITLYFLMIYGKVCKMYVKYLRNVKSNALMHVDDRMM